MARGMYNRPMTEEEERMMMAQRLRQGNNNMMVADNNTAIREPEYPADYTTRPSIIPPDADMSQYNDLTGTGVIGSGVMTENEANMLRNNVSPMGTSMTPEQIDEEINRLQMLKNQMMMGN